MFVDGDMGKIQLIVAYRADALAKGYGKYVVNVCNGIRPLHHDLINFYLFWRQGSYSRPAWLRMDAFRGLIPSFSYTHSFEAAWNVD
jgi:hypothetical protein